MNVVNVDFDPMDDFAKLWQRLMTEVKASPLSMAEKIGTLEYIKHELMTDMLSQSGTSSA